MSLRGHGSLPCHLGFLVVDTRPGTMDYAVVSNISYRPAPEAINVFTLNLGRTNDTFCASLLDANKPRLRLSDLVVVRHATARLLLILDERGLSDARLQIRLALLPLVGTTTALEQFWKP